MSYVIYFSYQVKCSSYAGFIQLRKKKSLDVGNSRVCHRGRDNSSDEVEGGAFKSACIGWESTDDAHLTPTAHGSYSAAANNHLSCSCNTTHPHIALMQWGAAYTKNFSSIALIREDIIEKTVPVGFQKTKNAISPVHHHLLSM